MRIPRRLRGLACSLLLPLVSSACSLPGKTGPDTTAVYVPTWISASWDSGAGPPDLRFDRDAVLHFDAICPAYAMSLRVSVRRDSVSVLSNCDRAATVYVCASSSGPGLTVPSCSDDPLETPTASLTAAVVAAGATSDMGTPAPGMQLEVFYCGDQSTMMFVPLRCTR